MIRALGFRFLGLGLGCGVPLRLPTRAFKALRAKGLRKS